jgi:hypothetical protein
MSRIVFAGSKVNRKTTNSKTAELHVNSDERLAAGDFAVSIDSA